MSSIKASNIQFAYDKKAILNNVNIEIKDGWTSIVGPNGAGKSTLINIINGSLKPRHGHVEVCKESVGELKPEERARLFTTIHQQSAIRFPITCFDMVSFGRYPWRENMNHLSQEDYTIIHRVMEETDTLQYKDQSVTELSGGEKQRVILASALAQEPKVLLIDEGFSALDIKHKSDMVQLIKKRIREEQLGVVAIIHDLNVAYQISDQVIMMKNGEILHSGPRDIVMTKNNIETVYETKVNFDTKFGISLKMMT